MKTLTLYDETGEIIGHTWFDDNVDLSLVKSQYSGSIEGYFDMDQYKIQDNIPVKKENIDVFQNDVRKHRDQMLAAVDRINPVWYASLTEQHQTELQAYRQALLDVPQQPGFPADVIWPSKPDWL